MAVHPVLLALLATACLSPERKREKGMADEIDGLLVTPDGAVVPVGGTVQFVATGLLDGRDAVDLTGSVDWLSTDPSVLSVSDDLDLEGLGTGLSPGVAQVIADYEGTRSPSVTVSVTDSEVERLALSPTSVDLEVGRTVQMTATATFSSGEQGDVSASVRWITDDGAVARFEGDGLLSAIGAGRTDVHVEWEETASDEVPVTVSEEGEAGAPDLYVSAASGSIDGGVLGLSVTVHNTGTTGASGFWIDVFVDPTSTPDFGDTGDAYEWVDYVGPDRGETVSFDIDVDDGDHAVTVLVDTNDDVEEEDESNNTFSTTVSGGTSTSGGPNLAIDWFDYTADEETVYYYADVTNNGDEDADWFYVDLFVDASSEPSLYEDGDDYAIVDGLGAGETTWADFAVDAWCWGCESWLLVDGYDNVAETDEDDNTDGPLYVYSE